MTKKAYEPGMKLESNTEYYADKAVYDIFSSDDFEEIKCWWTILNSSGKALRAVNVLRNLENVTVDLGGAKLILHGRIMPFAVFDCKNITFRNFSIDYDRPFYTQGKILESNFGSLVIEIPPLFRYRIEGHDFIAEADTWEHRLNRGDMLFRAMDPKTGRPSSSSGTLLGLIGDEIFPRPNPPLPIHHIYAEDLGNRKVRLSNFPEEFSPAVGEILAMTHEDRRKTAFLLERNCDTKIEHVRLIHVGAMGITANLCHNISLDDFSMYTDSECPDRIITVNADSFHCFHCTGLMKVENCRFEGMLDDAVNIHGNYLVFDSMSDSRTITAYNLGAGLMQMEYLLPGDEITIRKGNSRELRAAAKVVSAEYLPNQHKIMVIKLDAPLGEIPQKGDCIENQRMPEIEIRNCKVKSIGGFRISSSKKTVIENCFFENAAFSVLFSGDMNYWFENGPVKDVTVRNCTFERCCSPVLTSCFFAPTEKEPFYHENISFIDNTVILPETAVMCLQDVRGICYHGNKVIQRENTGCELALERCSDVNVS